eukprot:s3190_g7.t2
MQISASKDVRKRFSTLLPHEASLATRRQRIAAEHRRASQRFQRLQVVVRLLPAPEAELATAFLQWHSLLAKRQRRDAEDLVATTVLFAAWKGCVLAEVRARREETWAEAVPLSTFNMEGGGYCSVAQRALPSGGVFRSPMAGLGTCLVSEGDVTRQVSSALDTGYRVIDTAQRYGNEAGIGRALKEAFDKGLRRDEVFVTTKVWPTNYGFDKAIGSVQDSAKKLGLEAIDLVLPHWPGLSTSIEAAESNFRLRRETWKALEQMKKDGLVKNIGVSNYNDRHLTELLDYADTLPMASQFEIHPFNTREMLVQKCQKLGIRVNAYSPLGGKGNPNQVTDKLLSLQLLTDIGSAHGKTPAQTILRWHLQRGVTPIPKASSAKRLGENFDVFDFELSDQEMQEISGLDRRRFAVMDSEEQRGRLANMQLHLVKERRFRRLADARATLAGVQVLEAKLPAGVVGVVPIRAIEEVQALCFAAWQLRTAKNAVRRGNLQSHGEKQISVAQSIAPSLLRAGNCKLMLHAVRCLTAWCRICFTNKCHRHGQKQTLTLTWRCRDVVRRSQVFAAWALVARSSFSRKRAAKVASKAVITARNSKGLCRVFWGWKCAAAVGRSEQQVQQEARASAKECRALCKKVEDRSNRWKERALHLPRHLVSRQVLWAWRLTASSWSRPERELAWRVCRRAMDLQIKALAWRSWEHWVSRAAAMRRLVFASWRQVQLQSLGRRSASQLEALQLHTSTVTQALRTRVRKAFRGAVDFAASSQSQCLLCNAFGQWRRFASAALARPFEGELKEAVTQVQLLAAQRQSCALQQALCSQQRLRAFGWRDLAWMHWRLSCAGRQNRSHSGELAKKMQQLEEQFRTMVSLLNGSRHSFFNTKMHAQDRLLMRRVLQHLKLHTQAERADRELSANEACLQEEFQAFRSLRERGLSSLDSSAARAEQREQTATARCCLAAWHGHCEAAAARGLREDAQERWLRAQNWICRRVPECADARSAQLLLAFWAMRLGALVRGRRDFTRFAMDRLVGCQRDLHLSALAWLSWCASTDRCRTLWKLWAQAVDPKPQPVPSRGEHRESRHSARRSQSAPSALDSQDGTVTTPWAFACARFRRKGPRLELGFGDPTNYLISSSLRNGTAQHQRESHSAVLMCSGHGIILQTLLSAAIMIQAWSLEHRNPAEMGLSLGAAGEATGTSQKAEAPGWESFSFNIPSFLAGLTVGILFTVMALGFLTDRLDRRELAEAKEPEAPPAPLPRESLESLHLFGPRCTWLVAMLLVQSVSSLILDSFKGLMQRHMSLTFFLTMLVGLGGNAGGQSVVLTVRRLALGKPVQVSEQLHVGALLVLVMAPLAFVRAYMQQTPLSESLTVGASAAVITICATVVLQCGSSSRRSGRAGPHGHRGNSDCLRPQARRCRGALEALALSLQTRVRNPARSPRGRTRTLLQRLECKRTQLKSESLRLGDAAGLHVVSAVAGSYLRHDEPSFRHLPAKVAVVKLPGCL